MEDMTWVQFISHKLEDPLGILRYDDNAPKVKPTGYSLEIEPYARYTGANSWEHHDGEWQVTVRFVLVQPVIEDPRGDSGPAREGGGDGD